MGNTVAKPKAALAASDPSKPVEQVQRESNTGYASDLRPDLLGTLPPSAATTGRRAKSVPDYFAGRDALERARERFRYERDLARFNRRNDAVACSVACKHQFSQCRSGCDGSFLHNADVVDACTDKQSKDRSARAQYARESAILARQLKARNKSLETTRNGSMYSGAQQAVRGKDAVARRPVASVGVEQSLNQQNKQANNANQTRLMLAEAQKRQELESNKLGSIDE